MRGEFGDYICDTLSHGMYEDWEITEYECQRPRGEGGEEITSPPIDTLGGSPLLEEEMSKWDTWTTYDSYVSYTDTCITT